MIFDPKNKKKLDTPGTRQVLHWKKIPPADGLSNGDYNYRDYFSKNKLCYSLKCNCYS